MRNSCLNLLPAVMASLLAVSCSKDVFVDDVSNSSPNSTLTIRTRVGADNVYVGDGEAKISYPVNIYVFNASGECCETALLEEGSSSISIGLTEGTYSVYAVAGTDAGNYYLPTKGEAGKQSVIRLTGSGHGDLMAAGNVVTMVDGGENTLTLTLERKVMLVQNVKIGNVPSNIESVSVTLAPLYENLRIDGTYDGTDGSYAIELSNTAGTRDWESSGETYLLESSATNATVTVNMRDDSGTTTSYSYTCGDELKANYKINISGTYTESSGVELEGTIIGAEWAGEKDIVFGFYGSGTTTDDEPDGGDGGSVGVDVPEPGSLYMDKYYVLRAEEGDGVTVVTLMTVMDMAALDFDPDDMESVRQAVEAGIKELADGSDGVTGWRLPVWEEMDYINVNFTEVRLDIMGYGSDVLPGAYNPYFFMKEDGGTQTISSYVFSGDGWALDIFDERTRLRAFTTIDFRR